MDGESDADARPRTAGWDAPPKTGIAHLDAIITAIYARDPATLVRYVTGSPSECPVRGVLCPEGSPPGTPIHVFREGGGCEWEIERLDDVPGGRGAAITRTAIADGLAQSPGYVDRIVGVWVARPGADAPVKYRMVAIRGAVFDDAAKPVIGRQLFVDDVGLWAQLPGIGCNPSTRLLDSDDRYDVLIAPPP